MTDGIGTEKSQLECKKVGGLSVQISVLGNLAAMKRLFGYSVRETSLLL